MIRSSETRGKIRRRPDGDFASDLDSDHDSGCHALQCVVAGVNTVTDLTAPRSSSSETLGASSLSTAAVGSSTSLDSVADKWRRRERNDRSVRDLRREIERLTESREEISIATEDSLEWDSTDIQMKPSRSDFAILEKDSSKRLTEDNPDPESPPLFKPLSPPEIRSDEAQLKECLGVHFKDCQEKLSSEDCRVTRPAGERAAGKLCRDKAGPRAACSKARPSLEPRQLASVTIFLHGVLVGVFLCGLALLSMNYFYRLGCAGLGRWNQSPPPV